MHSPAWRRRSAKGPLGDRPPGFLGTRARLPRCALQVRDGIRGMGQRRCSDVGGGIRKRCRVLEGFGKEGRREKGNEETRQGNEYSYCCCFSEPSMLDCRCMALRARLLDHCLLKCFAESTLFMPLEVSNGRCWLVRVEPGRVSYDCAWGEGADTVTKSRNN